MSDFARKLGSKDVMCDEDKSKLLYEDEPDQHQNSDDEDNEDDQVDTTQEGIDDSFLLLLAEDTDWTPSKSRDLLFVETSIALPKTAVCVDCLQDNKMFSKSQLAKHPDERRCKDCVNKSMGNAYGPAQLFGGPKPISSANEIRNLALPEQLIGAHEGAGVAVCSVCRLQLTKANCSASQRAKAPSRRKCNRCLGIRS